EQLPEREARITQGRARGGAVDEEGAMSFVGIDVSKAQLDVAIRPSGGKAKKLALTACMRKLLTVLNAMARSNTPWRLLPMGTQDSC
ncbi:MAG TPA: hypothetical protein VGL86_31585, partial [Polyangia bacterium]